MSKKEVLNLRPLARKASDWRGFCIDGDDEMADLSVNILLEEGGVKSCTIDVCLRYSCSPGDGAVSCNFAM
jgi:hypothetical protein